ncbi:MAG TPA: signal recognition particle-docking protein FtsY [Gammaproteobacteria bacterium]|nr:signal recognition particle-docking protein FtsY [Gammaproteobacteria bacterium]
MFGFKKRSKDNKPGPETPEAPESVADSDPAPPAEDADGATSSAAGAEKKTGLFARFKGGGAEQAEEAQSENAPAAETDVPDAPEAAPEAKKKGGLFARLKAGLKKTRSGLTEGVASLVLGRRQIDDELLDELETQLLVADVGVEATAGIIQDLTQRVKRKQLSDAEALVEALREDMSAILAPCTQPLEIDTRHRPYVILMVGVNGVGKTTTIGKLARRLQEDGKQVMLAAGDTFRAAAVEQLQVWGERNHIPVIAQHQGADSASVIYDALQAARAREADVLIADTAGRLHTQSNLMEELKKIKRVLGKLDDTAPHEVMLVVDAGTGQNALNQALQFHEAVGVTGITLTKLDGTAKGGIIFAIAKRMGIPIRFIGVGETIEDLRVFDASEFVAALFETENEAA